MGASGSLFGLLLAFAMLYPHEKMMLIFLPVPLPAWLFVTGYAVVELFQGVTGTQAGVAHFAHLGGMLGGFVLIQYWRGRAADQATAAPDALKRPACVRSTSVSAATGSPR